MSLFAAEAALGPGRLSTWLPELPGRLPGCCIHIERSDGFLLNMHTANVSRATFGHRLNRVARAGRGA